LTSNNPETGLITYFYDNNGNLTQKVMPSPNQTGTAAHTISFCYDALNRATGKAYSWQSTCPNGLLPQGTAVISYNYDAGTNGISHLTGLTDQPGSATYSYDIVGRLGSESRTIAGITKTMSYTYNLDNSVATLTYPSGAVITYSPDSAGRVLSAVDSGNQINYVTAATYNAPGLLTGSTYGQTASFIGILNTVSFNGRLQPLNLWSSSPTRTLMNLVYDFHIGTGDNGNVFAITNNRDTSRNQMFTYDSLNRLLSAQNAGTDCTQILIDSHLKFWGDHYSYDAWGNLLQKTPVTGHCSGENLSVTVGLNNQLQGAYTYDAAGNMMHDATANLNYTYDPENRIIGTAGFTYTYDADGNRVEKTNGNTTPATGTLYWYMTPGIVAESDLLGNIQSEYVFFDGERVARRDFPNNVVSYYFSDHLKTASVISDAVGSIIKAETDYYPWGGELQFVNDDSNHYKFTGKERDSETGLDYFGARHYSNALARFITADWSAAPEPVPYADFSDPQALNLYSYVRNLPTSRYDPDGHQQQNNQHPHLSAEEQVDVGAVAYSENTRGSLQEHQAIVSVVVNRANSDNPQYVGRGQNVTVHNVANNRQFQGANGPNARDFRNGVNNQGAQNARNAAAGVSQNGPTTTATHFIATNRRRGPTRRQIRNLGHVQFVGRVGSVYLYQVIPPPQPAQNRNGGHRHRRRQRNPGRRRQQQ
jgi:RHS repeat-associated protein